MWLLIRLFCDLALLFVVVVTFAAAFDPVRSQMFFGNKPIKPGAIRGIRIIAVITFLLVAVTVVVDVLDLAGVLSKGDGS